MLCWTNIPVWVAVESGWLSMGSPSGVCDTVDVVGWLGQVLALGLLVDQVTEFLDLSDLLAGKHLLFLAFLDNKTGGVVSAVLEVLQFCRDELEGGS